MLQATVSDRWPVPKTVKQENNYEKRYRDIKKKYDVLVKSVKELGASTKKR